jgi:hypothetical protein
MDGMLLTGLAHQMFELTSSLKEQRNELIKSTINSKKALIAKIDKIAGMDDDDEELVVGTDFYIGLN